jgi:hypothetical protein
MTILGGRNSLCLRDKGAQTREELAKLERFRQVVIRTDIESGDAVVDRIASGEHEYRFLRPVLAELRTNFEAVFTR